MAATAGEITFAGFTSSGIAAGSVAAGIQSSIGSVAVVPLLLDFNLLQLQV